MTDNILTTEYTGLGGPDAAGLDELLGSALSQGVPEDVLKGVTMFRTPGIEKDVLGLVENMAWFTPEELPDNKYYIFGKDGGVKMAKELGLELLGQIPLVQGIRESGDFGEPSALKDSPDGLAFKALADNIVRLMP